MEQAAETGEVVHISRHGKPVAVLMSEPLRQLPDPAVMAQMEHGTHALYTASVVLHELSYGIHRLAPGRTRERLGGAQLVQPAMSSTLA